MTASGAHATKVFDVEDDWTVASLSALRPDLTDDRLELGRRVRASRDEIRLASLDQFIARCRAQRLMQGLPAEVEDDVTLDAVATILDHADYRVGGL